MLEGALHRVLLGYLQRYVKDFSKDQLKFTLRNIEVELKDIQLIIEAFDYLQLPFALKEARIGKLSIKVQWNRIGGVFLIALEDVFFHLSPRDDHEWSMDAVERRELAGKKAKLAAAELTKLSRRVCGNKEGWSFGQYITAKLLENIQLSIKNFHVKYSEMQSESEEVLFGLRLSSLTISKQSPVGNQVSKNGEIEVLEIYFSNPKGAANFRNDTEESNSWCSSLRFVGDNLEYLLEPLNISMSLLVSRSDQLTDLPQYSISAKLTGLAISLNEIELRQILILSDYFCTNQLRERYGRYRPWCCLSRKAAGWQILWWHYAQESILSDVRKKLRKTSWRYLGQRLSTRRKYVNLYKTKLEFLRRDQIIDESILKELEQMEKECDIDDILSYRSAAESELQEVLSKSLTPCTFFDKSRKDDSLSGKSQGWLNWLSRGMLGAGGTDDASQFSGIVSDEDVQEIYEAAKFHPPILSGVDADANDKIYTCSIYVSIDEVSITVRNSSHEIAKMKLCQAIVECKLQEECASVIAFYKSGAVVYPCNKKVILLMEGSSMEKKIGEDEPSYRVQVDFSPKLDVELSVNVLLQSLQVVYDTDFFLDFAEFLTELKSFKFHHDRVLLSLNGIEDDNSRLLAKAQFLLSNHKKLMLDVSITGVTVDVPLRNAVSEQYNMVLELGHLHLTSKPFLDSCARTHGQSDILKHILDSLSSDMQMCIQLQDLYDCYQIKVNDVQMKLMIPCYPRTIPVLEKFCASISLVTCIIPYEILLYRLEVNVLVSSLDAHFSKSICESVIALTVALDNLNSRSEAVLLQSASSTNSLSSLPQNPAFGFIVTAKFDAANLLVDLENNGENSSVIRFSLKNLDAWYCCREMEECWICLKSLGIITYSMRDEKDFHVLCSARNLHDSCPAYQYEEGGKLGDQRQNFNDKCSIEEACFLLHYEARRSVDFAGYKCTVCLTDADFHCYPYVFGLLAGFIERISSLNTPLASKNSLAEILDAKSPKTIPSPKFRRFGFSNFSEKSASDPEGISLDCFPFVTIYNSGSLSNPASLLRFSILDWRKFFNLRNRNFRNSRCCAIKGPKSFHLSPLKSISGMDAFPMLGRSADTSQIDLNLSGVRVHFHDSSCIVGIVTLPNSKSSLCLYEDSMDLVSSTEGLILTSSWWTKNFNDFLWGPSLPNLSPILNIRVRKGNFESLNSQVEVSIGVQHVCCVLPPEYLAIIIGYFSLPDWSSNSSEQPVRGENLDSQNETALVYKVEVLDSNVILPVESNDHQFLKIDLQQLYFGFVDECGLSGVLNEIPQESMVPAHKLAITNHSLNIFGRDLTLSLLLFKDDGYGSITHHLGVGSRNVTLIAPFSADLWVRIPCESEALSSISSKSICIMLRIGICQLIVDDCYFFVGLDALPEIINHFSLVEDESKNFTDVLQFLQLMRCVKENGAILPTKSPVPFTEVRCCVESLLVQFRCLGKDKDLVLLEPVAQADMKFMCSASFVNEILISLDLSFSSFSLYSLLNSVALAQCTNTFLTSSVLDLSLSKSIEGVNELRICLPSLDIWLHIFDWTEVINLLDSYGSEVVRTAKINASRKSSSVDAIGPQNVSDTISQISDPNSCSSTSHFHMKKKYIFIVRSENFGIKFHFPIFIGEEALSKLESADIQEERPQDVLPTAIEGKQYKFLMIAAQSKGSELLIGEENVKLKCIVEKVSGTGGACADKSSDSWPLFQIYQVNVETEICNYHKKPVHVNLGVHVDRLDIGLTHQVFLFWHGLGIDVSEAGSSKYPFDSMEFKIQLRKASFLVSDGRWKCSVPLLEILMKNFLLHGNMMQSSMDSTASCDFQVNYNNIHKVFWEPFIEPWKFQMCINRKQELNALVDSSFVTEILVTSSAQLNFNFTEPFFETASRMAEMIKDAWGLLEQDPAEDRRCQKCQPRYAPYVLQNLTSLPLVYRVYQGVADSDQFDASKIKDGRSVQSGATVPIYLTDTPEEQLFHRRPAHSSDSLSEKHPKGVAHHLMTIQLDGMSVPSVPVSMDLVGITYIEADFSYASNYNLDGEECGIAHANNGFVVPVVFDVSVQRHSKLIRLYSTVLIFNATSAPLELRFDIPFGISPKILDPVYPGQEFPLPLHLAGAGRMRWRPLGNSYLWSEAHNLSDILFQESKVGFLKSVVCYPSHPSNDPFRCCLSIEHISLDTYGKPKKDSLHYAGDSEIEKSKNIYIQQMTLRTPLVVNNYLPEAIWLTVESGGITRTTLLSEVVTSFHHIDVSHDLVLEFNMHGCRPSVIKFPRIETFSIIAKLSGTKFSQSETLAFDHDLHNGTMYVTVEKVLDAFSGARELVIFVPFLLYNCTAFPLTVSDCANEMKRTVCTVHSCYGQADQELFPEKRDGLSLLFSDQDSCVKVPQIDTLGCSISKDHIVSTRKMGSPPLGRSSSKLLTSAGAMKLSKEQSNKHEVEDQEITLNCLKNSVSSRSQLMLRENGLVDGENRKINACIYSPHPIFDASEIMVRLSRWFPGSMSGIIPNDSWSNPFPLVPPSGSMSVLVPQSMSNAAFIISVTCSAIDGPLAGKTRAITFQPRYIICNACSKDICYRQKGTNIVFNLGVGRNCQLQWTDTTRELLVSMRFDEPGWQWSGSFLPDHLGDTQVKIRNYISGALKMIRVEVQNADDSIRDEKIVGSLPGNSGTNLILLSEDDTGFMPYRIDNFSNERLRIYQQRCESFDTIVHPYNSCPYAWDEPCYPHRLTIEVPGERIVGSYALDDVKEFFPVHLKSTSEKPERTLRLSMHAEGATKVLSIIDSSYHILKDMSNRSDIRSQEKRKQDLKQEKSVNYKEKISLRIPCIGISLINSYPQELLFACAKNITFDLIQSVDQQQLKLLITSLQIDNQLRNTPYPVILSFNNERRSSHAGQLIKDDGTKSYIERGLPLADSSCEPVFYLGVAKWKKKDVSLVSFEYITLRVADFRLELEHEVILSLLYFFKAVSLSFQSQVMPFSEPVYNVSFTHGHTCEDVKTNGERHGVSSPIFNKNASLPSIVPIGAPWQEIHLLAKKERKIYVESFDLAPIKFMLSFSSSPWMLRNGSLTSGESLIHRGLMALADIEGAQIYLKQLTIAHQMASWESIQEILIRHYTRQLIHEMYKVFGSAGVIGNPMGFARSLGAGISDFLSAPARNILKSPTGLIAGMAQGTTSLLSNTVYALSDAATQFSKAAHKGIVAFTFDEQAVSRMEKQQKGEVSHSKGVINEVFEGLTGLLHSPIKEAEKHGLPGILSGMALGVTGLVARPVASILEVTGKTAQSIRNRSRLYSMRSQRYRVRLPRHISREFPLRPYSWEEAVGASVLMEADDGERLKDEVFVMCKALNQPGKFVILTEKLILVVSCSSLVDLGKPEFRGIPLEPKWVIETEISLQSVIHADADDGIVHIVGSSSDALVRQNQHLAKKGIGRRKRWNNPCTPLPLFQTNLVVESKEDAEELLQVLLATIELGKELGWGGGYILHQSSIK